MQRKREDCVMIREQSRTKEKVIESKDSKARREKKKEGEMRYRKQ